MNEELDETRVGTLVVGGGNAGISLAARMLRDGTTDVAVLEPSLTHRYRPLMNYAGAGLAGTRSFERSMGRVMPECTWIQEAAASVDPASSRLVTSTGRVVRYSTLVLAAGLEEDWDATPGLQSAYSSGWAGSTYVPSSAPLVWDALKKVTSGTVVFNVPPEPSPCGPTALKPLLMACDHWESTGVLPDVNVVLVLPGRQPLGVPGADPHLEEAFVRFGITVMRRSRVVEVDPVSRTVVIERSGVGRSSLTVTYAHLVPSYRGHPWVTASGMADEGGLVDIDPETLQHREFPNVWAIGDGARIDTLSSGGALRKQVDVLAQNLASTDGLLKRYDGYTVMPVTTSRKSLMLVQADRKGPRPRVLPGFFFKPRTSAMLFDRYVLPVVYFRRLLRGKV